MNLFHLLRPRPLRLTTYLVFIAFLFAVMFIVLLSAYSYLDNRKTVMLEIRKSALHNQRIVEAIVEKHLDTLESTLKNAGALISDFYRDETTPTTALVMQERLKALYNRASSGSLDILFLQLNDGTVLDVSSPFFAAEALYSTRGNQSSDGAVIQSADDDAVYLIRRQPITSAGSGKVAGTLTAAMVINDNLPLLQEMVDKTTAQHLSLLWSQRYLLSNAPASAQKHPLKPVSMSAGIPYQKDGSFYVNTPLKIIGVPTALMLRQAMSDELLTQLNHSIMQRIIYVFLATLISAGGVIYTFRYLTKRSLNTILHLTEAAFRSPEPAQFNATLVSEFNILGESIRDLDHKRKESERQVLLSSSVFDNAAEGIVITDLEGNIEQVNPACETMSGYTRDELIGENPRIFKSNHHDIDFYRGMLEAITDAGQWEGEVWNRRKNGEVYPLNVSISRCNNSSGEPTYYVAIFHDISEIKRSEEQLQHQAYHDALTGLPNRKLFRDRLNVAVAHAHQHRTRLAVIYLDIDNFKNINDTLGHHYGDKLLQQISKRLVDCTRQEDTTARIGGDEFIILMPEIDEARDITVLCRRILKHLELPHTLSGREYSINVSMGVTIYPDDADTPEDLIKNADIAMYRVKDTGKNGYQLFTSAMQETIMKRIELESRLNNALCHNEFVLYFQPQVDLTSRQVVGAEALIRWQHEDGSLTPPNEFIPVAEECGLIQQIDNWVLKTACTQANQWRQQGHRDIKISVNLSSVQFNKDKDLVGRVKRILDKTGFPPRLLTLEITENAVMTDTNVAIQTMKELTDLGIAIAIDDFGTGYSSLSYVKNFPAKYLKIDRSFVKDIPHDSDDMAIAASIITLAKNLRMKVIAEGVETDSQSAFLAENHCQQVQGYLFGRPQDAETFEQQFLNQHKKN
ncbi:MAG: hypothetical protein C0620_12720 [Desulfuromonas sp.]|nr:MAG: hypothetical protein C0620_12720 [Desulfuromonas sp.]